MRINKRFIGKLQFILQQRRKPSRVELDFWLGARARKRLTNTRFIGVTGSAGKSTCTALLHHLLGEHFRAAASLFENTPRVHAKRICQISKQEQFALMEMSGHAMGVLEQSCALIQPEMGIVISVSNDHYTNFRGIEQTTKEKSTLVRCIPAHGLVFLNADDPAVHGMAAVAQAKVISFGHNENSDYRALNARLDERGWLCFDCQYQSQSVAFKLPLSALHFVPSVLAAVACAHQCGIPLDTLARQAEGFQALPGRCYVHQLDDGRTVVCDTIKAPFSTLHLAFATLEAFPRSRPRRIILGNISDYPGNLRSKLRHIADHALTIADQLILLRPVANPESIIKKYGEERVQVFDQVTEIQTFLLEQGSTDDVLLLKGSSVNHLERLLLPWLGQTACDRESCGFRHSCFQCEYGFDTQHAPLFPRYAKYSAGLVAGNPQAQRIV